LEELDDVVLQNFYHIVDCFQSRLQKLSVKRLACFSHSRAPSKLFLNLGLAIQLACQTVDPSCAQLSGDKATLKDRTWSGAKKFFAAGGKVVQLMRRFTLLCD